MKPSAGGILTILCATLLSAAGCGPVSASPAAKSPQPSSAVANPAASPTALTSASSPAPTSETSETSEPATPQKKVVVKVTDPDGYQMRLTVTYTKWIKGSDIDALTAAWHTVGGAGEAPLSITSGGAGYYKASHSAVFYGTVAVENLTTDYDATDFGGTDPSVQLIPSMPASNYTGVISRIGPMAIQAGSNGATGFPRLGTGSTFTLVTPKLSSDSWGPMPFAVGIDNVFSPKYPKGNPLLNTVVLYTGFGVTGTGMGWKVSDGNSFAPGRSW